MSQSRQPQVAADAMVFGQETGRALSDGRIVGRAEPFIKVFTGSTAVKRAVGAVAWVILEEIGLAARLDDSGRLVARVTVRELGDRLGLNKETVTEHLRRLRAHGFVFREEGRMDGSGRFSTQYVLDPSACIERFTRTPAKRRGRRDTTSPEVPDGANAVEGESVVADANGQVETSTGFPDWASPEVPDRSGGAVRTPYEQDRSACKDSSKTGGGVDEELSSALQCAGINPSMVRQLLSDYDHDRIRRQLALVSARSAANPAGLLITAIRREWVRESVPVPADRCVPPVQEEGADAGAGARGGALVAGWDDDDLRTVTALAEERATAMVPFASSPPRSLVASLVRQEIASRSSSSFRAPEEPRPATAGASDRQPSGEGGRDERSDRPNRGELDKAYNVFPILP